MLKCEGTGDLIVSSYGAVQAIDLAEGQTYRVDTGHMVGWEESVTTCERLATGSRPCSAAKDW